MVDDKVPKITPKNPPPEILSESEMGWVAATKIVRYGFGPSNIAVQHSAFALFQKENQEGGAYAPPQIDI